MVLVSAACGGGSGGSIGFEDLPDELERAQCESLVACGYMPDVETCLAALFPERDEELKTLGAAIEAGTIVYNGENAAACLEFFGSNSCRFSESVDEGDFEAACANVFVGQVPEGGTCITDEECANDGDCEEDPTCVEACCEGTCIPGEGGGGMVPIGGDCSEADCVDGAYCKNDFMTGSAVCEAVVAEGGECMDWDACEAGLFCAGYDFGATPGTCAPPPDRGESCAETFGICDRADDYCDPADMICKARKQPGEACTVDSDECVEYAVCFNNTCTALPGAGESCADVEECLGDLDCSGGTCAPPPDEPGCEIPAP